MSARRLVALPGGQGAARPPVLACSHCAARSEAAVPAGTLPASRVCGRCGLGLVFAVAADLAPRPADPFLLVDGALHVSAVSRRAETLLGTKEPELVGRHLADVLAPADVGLTAHALAALVVEAAAGGGDVTTAVVRPPGEFGVRWTARIGRCGPPTAAIVLLAAV